MRHDLYKLQWMAMGMILMKWYLDFGYFPIFISYCFIHYCLYGESEKNELIGGFLNYFSNFCELKEEFTSILKKSTSEMYKV